MSGDKRPTADMLLVNARRRRLLAGREGLELGRIPSSERGPSPETIDAFNVLVAEEDSLIEEEPDGRNPSQSAAPDAHRPPLRDGGVHCYRPLAAVTLARLAWSGVIDHAVLHEAIGCAPVDADARAPNLVRRAAAPALRGAPHGEPSLYVRLGDDDVAALERALESASADIGARIASAALLPDALIGAPDRAAYAASQALAGYRVAAMVAAWREVMGAPGLAEVTRDRDSAAVRLLSTLRALLGEA